MNSVGLTTFIAVVGIDAGPEFVVGLKQAGIGLFFAGVFVTLTPLVVGIYAGKYLFKMHPAIILGACSGSRAVARGPGRHPGTSPKQGAGPGLYRDLRRGQHPAHHLGGGYCPFAGLENIPPQP